MVLWCLTRKRVGFATFPFLVFDWRLEGSLRPGDFGVFDNVDFILDRGALLPGVK